MEAECQNAAFFASQEREEHILDSEFEIDPVKIKKLREVYCCDGQNPNEIYVTGISGRFPSCDNVKEFRDLLLKKTVPKPRSRVNREYFDDDCAILSLNDIRHYDREALNVTPAVANAFDPMLRILQEVSYEAVVDAGYEPSELRGRKIGVYCGLSRTDDSDSTEPDFEVFGIPTSFHASVRSYYANYVSYVLDFKGPSFVLFADCSSFLNALLQANDDLKHGRCEAALVITAQLDLITHRSKYIADIASVLNGSDTEYKFGECVGALFLQKAKLSRRAYAAVVNVAQVQYGYLSKGRLVSEHTLEELFQKAYKECGINPRDVSYVECDHPSPLVRFETEINAIKNVFCESRKNPLYVGTVKSTVGYCGAASGFCAVARAILSLQSDILYPTPDAETLSSKYPWLNDGAVRIIKKSSHWPGALVGVNSFSVNGSLVHACLRKVGQQNTRAVRDDMCRNLMLYSSRTEAGVRALLDFAKTDVPPDFSTLLGRVAHAPETHAYRGFHTKGNNGSTCVKKVPGKRPPLWFIFNGMGAEWQGMGVSLMKIDLFASIMHRLADNLKPCGIDLMDIMMPSSILSSVIKKSLGQSTMTAICIQVSQVLQEGSAYVYK